MKSQGTWYNNFSGFAGPTKEEGTTPAIRQVSDPSAWTPGADRRARAECPPRSRQVGLEREGGGDPCMEMNSVVLAPDLSMMWEARRKTPLLGRPESSCAVSFPAVSGNKTPWVSKTAILSSNISSINVRLCPDFRDSQVWT